MGTFLLVCICGGLGAVARFMLNTSIQRWWHRAYPLSTFIINIIAALCAGTAGRGILLPNSELFHLFAVCRRFSGWFLHVLHGDQRDVSLTRTRQLAVAAFYFLTTLVVPFCAVVLGWFFGSIGH